MVPEADARLLFQQLIVAMDYCHRLGIVNRDVKVGRTTLQTLWTHCYSLHQGLPYETHDAQASNLRSGPDFSCILPQP